MAVGTKVVGAFLRLEEVDQLADEEAEPGHGALAHPAQHSLEAGERLLNRVGVRTVGGRKMRRAPATLMASRTLARLCLVV